VNFLFVNPKLAGAGCYYNFPIGLAYIVSYMKHKGFSVHSLNLCHSDEPVAQQLSKCIEDKKIDAVCTGSMSFYWNEVSEVVEAAKKINPKIITVVGGALITSGPKLAMENMNIDYGVIGEGEITMAELAVALISGEDINKVKGIIFRDNAGGFKVTMPREAIMNLDSLPFPDYESFEFGKWLSIKWMKPPVGGLLFDINEEKMLYDIITSRSCPFNCTFCYHPLGQKYRQRSLDNVFQEIDYLVEKYNINLLNILDELFSLDEKRLYAFASRIKNYNIRWMAQMRADNVSEDILKALKDSGILTLGIGMESMSDKILKSMKKHVKKADIERAYKLALDTGVRAGGNLIFGDPEETEETVKESLDWYKSHPEYNISLGLILAVPDSKVWRYAIERKLIGDKIQFIKKRFPVINLTRIADRKFNKIKRRVKRSKETLKYMMEGEVLSSKKEADKYDGKDIWSFTVECPLCRQRSSYRYFQYSFEPYAKVSCKNCYKRLKIKTSKAFKGDYNVIYGFLYQYAFTIYRRYLRRFIFFRTIAQGFNRIIKK